MAFKEISAKELQDNPFKLIGDDWMLVTAGTQEKLNMMTASWGGLGIMWHKPVAYAVIRPNRYTRKFIDSGDYFTLSFFDDSFKKALTFCGRNSGANVDKVKETGLTPAFDAAPYFEEARLVLICRKMFAQDMNKESFIDKDMLKFYKEDLSDLHTLYIAEIEKVLVKA